jgi:hypothetical protein
MLFLETLVPCCWIAFAERRASLGCGRVSGQTLPVTPSSMLQSWPHMIRWVQCTAYQGCVRCYGKGTHSILLPADQPTLFMLCLCPAGQADAAGNRCLPGQCSHPPCVRPWSRIHCSVLRVASGCGQVSHHGYVAGLCSNLRPSLNQNAGSMCYLVDVTAVIVCLVNMQATRLGGSMVLWTALSRLPGRRASLHSTKVCQQCV